MGRRHAWRHVLAPLVALALLAGGAPARAATAPEAPLVLPWPALLPALFPGVLPGVLPGGLPGVLSGQDPSVLPDPVAGLPVVRLVSGLTTGLLGGQPGAHASTACPGGRPACVDEVIATMRTRTGRLIASCDHDAAFALTYLRVTEAYRRAAANPRFFADTPFVNHEATAFAHTYFDAYDTWHDSTDLTAPPPAWQVALAAADRREVPAVGNLLLGLGAHVNRDLPLVLAATGLTGADGASRKPDHDRVTAILAGVTAPLLAEITRRLDPSTADANVNGVRLDETTLFQLLMLWREEAWRNAELLTVAPTPSGKALVAHVIERAAVLKQEALRAATAYRQPLTAGPDARDAYCRTALSAHRAPRQPPG